MSKTTETVQQTLSGKKTYMACFAMIIYGVAAFFGWSPDDSAFVDETIGQIEAGIGAIGAFIRMAVSKCQATIAEVKADFDALKNQLSQGGTE